MNQIPTRLFCNCTIDKVCPLIHKKNDRKYSKKTNRYNRAINHQFQESLACAQFGHPKEIIKVCDNY